MAKTVPQKTTEKPVTERPTGAHIEWCLISVFHTLTGYTPKAVEIKIARGVWIQGKHYKKAPDGHITMNLQEYYKWVEGEQRAAA